MRYRHASRGERCSLIAAQRKLSLISAFAVVLVASAGCPEPTAEPPPPTPDAGPPVVDCNNYTFRGEVYNCGAVDRCNLTDFETALACCECNPLYCDPDPTCPVDPGEPPVLAADTCMGCHNGSTQNDYAGPGISNPHPFGVRNISCTGCHGGDGTKASKLEAHVPPPPQVGDRQNQQVNAQAWFNRLTMSGLDTYPDWTVNGVTYEAVDYINFINPGDLRIVKDGRGCGACHQDHAWAMSQGSVIGTETGFFSSAFQHIGVPNPVVENQGLYQDTAADFSYRGTQNPNFNAGTAKVGEVGRTLPVPEYAAFTGPMYNNAGLTAAGLNADIITAAENPANTNKVRADSNLAKLYQTQISITCGDCHAGSAGANNRYADFRSSGCTTCHMEYSMDGRSRSTDPNVPKLEPANPDAIAAPERPHVDTHQVRNVAKILPNGGGFIRGISDRACVGCHQGSNRTVLQYWGIRLDQNQDVVNNFQYPANPVTFANTAADTRLFDPAVANNTFNGRNANQYILDEDYDGDARDDTPADVHYEAGLGCIDCHGSRDAHSGTEGNWGRRIMSKMDQIVQVRCESCHGDIDNYASTGACVAYTGEQKTCVKDYEGNAMRNTELDNQGNYWLISRVDGQRHYVPQTKDTIYPNNKRNPITNQLVYNANASYSMGRFNGVNTDGIGPQQTNPVLAQQGFSHTDNMDCISCHATWNNQCIGCHLRTQYDAANPNLFSNITGERIVQAQDNADFTYISPVMMYLGVNSKNKVTQISAGMKVFYAYTDLNGDTSDVFAFSDRNGEGNNPNYQNRNAHPSLGMYQMSAHSIRGRVTQNKEGAKYCVACHNTTEGLAVFGAQYADFVTAYANRDYANFDFDLLQEHIGQNTGNQLNSPFWVHMTAGLGSGLFLFDANGCPVNPLDANDNRFFCNGVSPQDQFNVNNVAYDLDRMVEIGGVTNVSSLHPMQVFGGANLRAGSLNANMAGTLGGPIINKLTNIDVNAGGKVLDSWLDANGAPQGDAANYINQ